MANNFSMEQAREKLASKTGIPSSEFTCSKILREGNFTKYKFYRWNDRSIIYTVLSEDEVNALEENCTNDYAP